MTKKIPLICELFKSHKDSLHFIISRYMKLFGAWKIITQRHSLNFTYLRKKSRVKKSTRLNKIIRRFVKK